MLAFLLSPLKAQIAEIGAEGYSLWPKPILHVVSYDCLPRDAATVVIIQCPQCDFCLYFSTMCVHSCINTGRSGDSHAASGCSRPVTHLKVYTPDEGDCQHTLVVMSQILFGHAQSHVGLLSARHVRCSLLAGCPEGMVLHLQEYRASVSLQMRPVTSSVGTSLCSFDTWKREHKQTPRQWGGEGVGGGGVEVHVYQA